jgi:hypothetical protein
MKYLMQRSQIFIRPNANVPFHNEIDPTWLDRLKDTTKEFTDDCEITWGYEGDNILRYTFYIPGLDEYQRMTDCLYDKGQLKEVFKDAMRHSKPNGIAFAMPSWWLNKVNENGTYVKEWYTNKKTRPEGKFLEEVKDTLPDRMFALKTYMSLKDCIMNCAVYDYTHTIKHSYFLYLKRDNETERDIDIIRQNASKNYQYKKLHNAENGIEYVIGRNDTTCFENHDFGDITEGTFSPDFTNLIIPIRYK